MFCAIMRAEEREGFTIPTDPSCDGGYDLIPVVGFYVGDCEDYCSETPWEQWTVDILDYLQKDGGALYTVGFVENIEDDLGHYHAENGEHFASLKAASDPLEASLRQVVEKGEKYRAPADGVDLW